MGFSPYALGLYGVAPAIIIGGGAPKVRTQRGLDQLGFRAAPRVQGALLVEMNHKVLADDIQVLSDGSIGESAMRLLDLQGGHCVDIVGRGPGVLGSCNFLTDRWRAEPGFERSGC